MTSLFPLAALMALLWSSISTGANAEPNPYVQSALPGTLVVHYTIERTVHHPGLAGGEAAAPMITGTETLYVEGDRYAKYLRMTSQGGAAPGRQTVEIVTPLNVYRLDLTARTGTKIVNPKQHGRRMYERLSVVERNAFHTRLASLGGGSIDLLAVGVRVSAETILGHSCDVYESGERPAQPTEGATAFDKEAIHIKTWIWRETGIPLRVRMEALAGVHDVRATKVERDVQISARHFAVPAGIAVTDDRMGSELAERQVLADFERIRTGKPQVIRVKVEPIPRAVPNTAPRP